MAQSDGPLEEEVHGVIYWEIEACFYILSVRRWTSVPVQQPAGQAGSNALLHIPHKSDVRKMLSQDDSNVTAAVHSVHWSQGKKLEPCSHFRLSGVAANKVWEEESGW